MKTVGLSGRSGTGKSYQAMNLCQDRGIEAIIDDGLFIYRNQVIAGRSAKRSDTKVGAIKTALFVDEDHRDQVVSAISRIDPKSILVIGTSEKMVRRIAQRLSLGPVEEIVLIEEITTEEERETAYKQRHQQGKHVVPVPSFQLKRQFSGYFMHPLRMIRGWGQNRGDIDEKSVVRPTYSYLGNFLISDKVIDDIVEQTADEIDGVVDLSRTISVNRSGELSVLIGAVLDMDHEAVKTAEILQKRCGEMIEMMTAFNIENVDVEIQGLSWDGSF